MISTVQPYCNGLGCPLKMECKRYKPASDIDYKNEDWMPLAPYNHTEKRCEFQVAIIQNNFVDHLKKIKKDGRD